MARMVRVAKYLLSCYWSSSNDLGEEDNEESKYYDLWVFSKICNMEAWINSGLTSNEGKLSNINVHGQCAQVFIFTALDSEDHNIMMPCTKFFAHRESFKE